MAECLYTESLIESSGAQLIVYAAERNREELSSHETNIKRVQPDAWTAFNDLMETARAKETDLSPEELPRVGDVIWVQTGGNKTIGFCLVRESLNTAINKKAIKPIFKSIANKAKELGINYCGMDTFSCTSGKEWSEISEEIEEYSADVTPIVCVPTNELLEDVLTSLPGKQFKMIKAK